MKLPRHCQFRLLLFPHRLFELPREHALDRDRLDFLSNPLLLEEAIEGPAYEESFLGLSTNGVEFAVGRQVFDAGGNGIELQCDACGVSFEPDDSWMDAVSAWFGGDDLVSFPCPSCGQQALLTEWRGPWPWGFGNLGIAFWNWPPLSDDFIHALTRKLGHRTVMVRRHL